MFKTFWIKFRSRFKAKRPFTLTRPGWVFILYTIGLGAGAINTGNNLLYLLFGFFLGMIMASGVLSDLSLWGLKAELSVPSMGEAGQPLYIPVRLANQKKWIPSLSVRLTLEGDLEGAAFQTELFIPALKSRGVFGGQFVWTPPRRGQVHFHRLKLKTRFPFGLLLKWWTHHDHSHELIITPRRVNIQGAAHALLQDDSVAMLSRDERGDSAVMRNIRLFRPSDSWRRIHWKASAKRTALSQEAQMHWLVKEMELDQHFSVQLDWPDRDSLFFSAHQFEQAVSITASLIVWLDQHGHRVSLRVGDSLLSDYGSMLVFLSLVHIPFEPRTLSLLSFHRSGRIKAGVSLSTVWRALSGMEAEGL